MQSFSQRLADALSSPGPGVTYACALGVERDTRLFLMKQRGIFGGVLDEA